MTTIIMLFILPLGIIFYFFDKKTKRENSELFKSYVNHVINSDLSKKDSLLKIDHMYYENGYNRVYISESKLIVEKKHFNLGVVFISFGLASYFGIIFYAIYYKYILKPDQIVII